MVSVHERTIKPELVLRHCEIPNKENTGKRGCLLAVQPFFWNAWISSGWFKSSLVWYKRSARVSADLLRSWTDFPLAQLETQTPENWKIAEGVLECLWKWEALGWMLSVRLSVFCGVIVKEPDLYSRKNSAFGSDLYQLRRLEGQSCLQDFIPVWIQLSCTEPVAIWASPGLCQGMDSGFQAVPESHCLHPIPSQQTAERVTTTTPRLSSCWSLPSSRHSSGAAWSAALWQLIFINLP